MASISLLNPVVAFPLMLAVVVLLAGALSRLVQHRKGAAGTQPYACGEESPEQFVQPNYGQFLPFAFFFTILHVVALMVATAAGVTAAAFAIALLYVLCAAVGLVVLYRN
jgi:NADH-quinone oxidoreductase subunit A